MKDTCSVALSPAGGRDSADVLLWNSVCGDVLALHWRSGAKEGY